MNFKVSQNVQIKNLRPVLGGSFNTCWAASYGWTEEDDEDYYSNDNTISAKGVLHSSRAQVIDNSYCKNVTNGLEHPSLVESEELLCVNLDQSDQAEFESPNL